MAKCVQSATEFIQFMFSPMVAVLTSDDAEAVCQKNDLSFVELVRPFCQLSGDAHMKDPVNPTVGVTIRNLHIRLMDLHPPAPPQQLINRVLNDIVSKTLGKVDLRSAPTLDGQMNATTSWYEAYRDSFCQLLKPMDHEFIRHFLACIIVVSSSNPDPMGTLVSLSAKQTALQTSTEMHNPHFKWFSSHTFKYYVLIHDVSAGEDARAEAIFQSMKSVYGSHTCFNLQINSRAKMLPNIPDNVSMPDHWNQFLYPFDDDTFDIDEDEDVDEAISPASPSPPKSQTEADKEEEKILHDLEQAEKMAEELHLNQPMRFQDPLTTMHYNDMLQNNENMDDLGPLKPGPPDLVKDIPKYKRSLSQEKTTKVVEYKRSLRQFSFCMAAGVNGGRSGKQKGQCLTVTDHDRIKACVYEFVVRGLLPHIEKLMRNLSEQILSRRGFHRNIFNATRKWFGGNKSAGGGLGSGLGAGVSYAQDAPELLQRRLGDLAFLVQHYELAYNSYHTAKREFNTDHAWVYFAGALEMAAISVFMQGPSKNYPVHYFEACISTYLNTCRLPDYATRACFMSTEALKARGMYADAAFEFIKLTNEDFDLRSALLLEQAAHCYLHNNPPMIRKYSFHMILAGHRYSKSVQRKHTLRCYTNALQIYKSKEWHLAEDHMNFIIGRQSFNLNQSADAQTALRELLIYESHQQPAQQAAHLREFLAVFKQNIERRKSFQSVPEEELPNLPLPKIEDQSTRVLMTVTTQDCPQSISSSIVDSPVSDPNRTRTIQAGLYSFKRVYNKNYIKRWAELEKNTVKNVTGKVPYPWRPFVPCLSSLTDNSYHPHCGVGETFIVELIFQNPLKIPLNLLKLHLIWEFMPESKEDVISNKKSMDSDYVDTEVIKNVIIKSQERKPVSLSLTFKRSGRLKITGIKCTLTSIAVANTVDDEGKVEQNPVQESTLLTFGVKGQQELEVRGPRLNSTKKEKTSVEYGNDRRLQPRILHATPRLEVQMVNFPVTLLCGEVRMTQFVFKNIGQISIKNIHMTCNRPQCLSFGLRSTEGACASESKDLIYETTINWKEKQETIEGSVLHGLGTGEVMKVPFSDDHLLPGAEIVIPVWIHGLGQSGVHELDFLFYYEPVEKVHKIPYRVVHQTVRIQTLSTMTVSATMRKSESPSNNQIQDKDTERLKRKSDRQLLISLNIENRAQGSSFPRCVEFSVQQITSYSARWMLNSVSGSSKGCQKLRPGESFMLHLKAEERKSETDAKDDNLLQVSHVPLNDELISGAKTPAIDFFSQTKAARRVLDSSRPNAERLGLIVFWQTSYIDDACVRHLIYGQTHAIAKTVNEAADDMRHTVLRSSSSLQMSSPNFLGSDNSISALGRSSCDTACGLNVSLRHKSVMEHDFSRKMFVIVPVTVEIQNCHNEEIELLIKTKDFHEESVPNLVAPSLDTGAAVSSAIIDTTPVSSDKVFDCVPCWIGRNSRKISPLPPNSMEILEFSVLVPNSGLYDLNSFDLFEVKNDGEQVALSISSCPSLLCVTKLSGKIDNIDSLDTSVELLSDDNT